MIEQKPKKLQRVLWVIKAELPDVEWLVRAFDTYEEACAFRKRVRDINDTLFNGESSDFGGENLLDPDMLVDDGDPAYVLMEVPYAS